MEPEDIFEHQAPLILKLRKLAGEIGAIETGVIEIDLPLRQLPDSLNYELEVELGLASAVRGIVEGDINKLLDLFRSCLWRNAVKVDDRIECLLDSLGREVDVQRAREEEEEEDDDEGD